MNRNTQTITFEVAKSKVPYDRIAETKEYWSDRSLSDVRGEMPEIERHGPADIIVVNPDVKDIDESQSYVVPLEYLQGYTESHYMRAKTIQHIAGPNSRVVIIPNNSTGKKHVDTDSLSEESKERLTNGDYSPYSDLLSRSLERADTCHSLGKLVVVGSSQGALSGLAIAGSELFDVDSVLAFETPSSDGRTAKQLQKDFQRSGGGLTGLWDAIKDSQIPAQAEAMRFPDRYFRDIAKFVFRSMTNSEARMLHRSMSGSADYLALPATRALSNRATLFVGVEGSTIYDRESLSIDSRARSRHLEIIGENAHAHATSNNLVLMGILTYLAQGRKR